MKFGTRYLVLIISKCRVGISWNIWPGRVVQSPDFGGGQREPLPGFDTSPQLSKQKPEDSLID